MKVQVQRTWKNVFKAKAVGNTIYVLANFWLRESEIREILSQNIHWFEKHNTAKSKETFGKSDNEFVAAASSDVLNATDSKPLLSKNFNNVSDFCGQNPFVHKAWNNKTSLPNNIDYCNMFCGKEVLYFGNILTVAPSETAKTRLEGGILYVFDDAYAQKDVRLKAVKTFLKRAAKVNLTSQFATFGTNVSLCAEKIEFKELHGDWFSCSDAVRRSVVVDFRVVQLPIILQKYIIAHCFGHFRFAEHNADFYRWISTFIPSYKDCEAELSKCQFLQEI